MAQLPFTSQPVGHPRQGVPAASAAAIQVRGRRPSTAMWLWAGLCFVLLFDPQWLAARYGAMALLRLPVLLYGGLAVMLTLEALTVREVSRRWNWLLPVLAFAGAVALSVPFAINRGVAFVGFQSWVLNWFLIVGAAALLDTPRRAEMLLIAYGIQFFWWTLWGTPSGFVAWHPALANYDTYGAWMSIGGGMCAFMAIAVARVREYRWFRNLMIVTVALCAAGVVASFARGAFLAAFLVGVVVWVRSPYKGRMLTIGLVCAVIGVATATLLYGDAYWQEMMTITQGTEESTGEDRWEMWKAAFGVFLEHPVIGVGFDNWGIFAASYYEPGELGGLYAANPAIFYGKSTHNIYVQILAETGIVGILMFAWIFVDFWRRNLQLRSSAAAQRWKAIGGRFDLRMAALGVEAAMVGWMANAVLYSMAGLHWLFTILTLNLVLHTIVRVGPPGAPGGRRQLRLRSSASAAGGGYGARRSPHDARVR